MSEARSESAGAVGRPRILLVDDEAPILAALRRELRRSSCEVDTCSSPLEALAAARERTYALVISDNIMPEMSGLDLFSRLQAEQSGTRRVLLTGRTHLERAVEAFNQGRIHRFVHKPWEREALLALVEEEVAHYTGDRAERDRQRALADAARQRTSQLRNALRELKQARTQVSLMSEGAGAARSLLSPRLKRLSVLVVDEFAPVRSLLAGILRKAGIPGVHEASGGAAALSHLLGAPPVDVVLSEWAMEGMDGLELFRHLREGGSPSAGAAFVLVTTRENRQAVETALQAGVDGYVIKPFPLKTLLGQLDSVAAARGQPDHLEDRIREVKDLAFLVGNADLDSRFHIQQVLAASGVRNVVMADTGPKALRILQERPVDMMIYDCNLRDPYWCDLDDALRLLEPSVEPPPLVLTSVTPMPHEAEEARAAGVTTFVPGAVERRHLFQAVHRAWSLSRLFQQAGDPDEAP